MCVCGQICNSLAFDRDRLSRIVDCSFISVCSDRLEKLLHCLLYDEVASFSLKALFTVMCFVTSHVYLLIFKGMLKYVYL